MNIRNKVVLSGLMAVLVLTMGAGMVMAETIYLAAINGVSAGTPSTAIGTATLTLNDAQTEVSYVITYAGLMGTEFAAHFHSGSPGVSGPVLTALPLGSPKTGVWLVGPTEVAMLDEGGVYINIHTDLYPAGEIRGDISNQTVPNEEMSFGTVKALFQ